MVDLKPGTTQATSRDKKAAQIKINRRHGCRRLIAIRARAASSVEIPTPTIALCDALGTPRDRTYVVACVVAYTRYRANAYICNIISSGRARTRLPDRFDGFLLFFSDAYTRSRTRSCSARTSRILRLAPLIRSHAGNAFAQIPDARFYVLFDSYRVPHMRLASPSRIARRTTLGFECFSLSDRGRPTGVRKKRGRAR